jgi:Fe-S cluster assembly iron-binding protein IscA
MLNILEKDREVPMLEVTDKASTMIRELLEGRGEPVSAIRIIVSEGG